MNNISFISVLVAIIALFHMYVFVLEAFLWKTPRGRKAFSTTAKFAADSHALAINQGVYNLFLAAGLVWSLLAPDPLAAQLQIFFLSCVVVAAVTGGLTVSKRIMLVQGLPAVVALLLVLATR
ncbi:MAG TPA: DUF1304 domain-containing protein [Candidatus Polarisedimenticolaceae bacterium]|nr:DUF1304 domain-containing protein [Candidatus Polarisedimenticolaceae bacterium]